MQYPKPFVQVPAAAAIVFLSAAQWWVAGRNYAKYAPESANPVKIIKVSAVLGVLIAWIN